MKAMVVLLICAALGASAARSANGSAFDEGNRMYEEGKYADALKAYEGILNGRQSSAALYFNIGNAYFKLGKLGLAIDAWRHAQELAPRDGAVRANLQFARTQARGGVPYHAEAQDRWLGLLTINEWTVATASAGWGFFILLAMGQWRPALKRRWQPWLIAAGVATAALGTCLAGSFDRQYLTTTAIVTTGEADVRYGPLEEAQNVFKVRDGLELEVVDRKDNWLQVVDSSQRMGWIRQGDCVVHVLAGTRK